MTRSRRTHARSARPSIAPPAASGLSTRARLAILLAGVFAVKLVVVLQLKDHILLQPDTTIDTGAYVGLAKRIIAGDVGLGPGLYFISPLYIYFLAVFYGLTDSLAAVRVVQIALGTMSVGLIFATAREWFGERPAWMAAALAALTGLFTFYEAVILQASIDAVLTSAALYFLTLALLRGTARWQVLAGLAFGVQALNRPNVLVAIVAVVVLLAAMRRLKPAGFVALGLVAALAPVGIRNVVVSHQWSLLSSQGGLNFLIGNGDGATGFFRIVPGVSPTIEGQEHDTRRVAEAALGRPLTDAEVSSYFSGLAWSWIRQHPAPWLALMARKLFYVLNAQHIPLPLSYPFYAYDANTLLRFLFVGPWLLMPLGLIGLVARMPADRRADSLVWVSFVPAYAIAVAVFFVSERYRLPLLVPLVIGAGAALDAIVAAAAARNVRALAVTGGALAALLVIVNWPLDIADGDGRQEERVHMAENLARAGRVAEAERWIARALPGNPYAQFAEYRVGTQFLTSEQWEPAIAHLSAALRLEPNALRVEFALGQALAGAGRSADAIPHLRHAVDGGVDVDLAGFDLALALQQTGDLAGAARVLHALVPGPGDDADVWLRVGRLAAEVKAPEVAEPFFRHAVAMAPDSAGARHQLGLVLLVLRRYDEAARELTESVRLDARSADALANLAYCEYQLGRPADARTHVDAALRIDPRQALALQLQPALSQNQVAARDVTQNVRVALLLGVLS